jgi:hypothetical protein
LTREANTLDAANVGKGRLARALFLLILLSFPTFSQSLPDKIRGYKVYRDKVSVNTKPADSDATVRIGDPEVVDVSLDGITFELPAELTAKGQSGKVDFVTFHDVRINGIKVEPEEYSFKFEFRKGELVTLPNSIRIVLPASGMVKAAWQEMTESRAEWKITGRVFVFGKFRRYGFFHKRVVPIDISFTMPNPVRGK